MKVYIDEFPKDCLDCPCESEYYCNLLHEDVGCLKWGEIHKDCPLQSLTDHDNQLRKEVVQKIRKYGAINYPYNPVTNSPRAIFMIALENLERIEQGETK